MPTLTRRGFVAAAMAGLAAADGALAADGAVPNSTGTERPRNRAPAKACDSHFHIIDARFPPPDTPKPPGMTVDDYRLLQARLGTTRAVPVQPKNHGTDPTCLLDALARFGGNGRGIAVLSPDVTDAELEAPRCRLCPRPALQRLESRTTRSPPSRRSSPWPNASPISAGTCSCTCPGTRSGRTRRC